MKTESHEEEETVTGDKDNHRGQGQAATETGEKTTQEGEAKTETEQIEYG